jgi:7-cyano-7-deazaguanine synthase
MHLKNECTCVTFDYGQTHRREIAAATAIADYYGVEHRVIDLAGVLGGSALTGDSAIPHELAAAPDATYVPARNLVMLSIGAAIAEQVQACAVLFGANSDDRSGYPDCRPEFVMAMNQAAMLGTARGVSINAPFVCHPKREVVAYGESIGAPLYMTWSCYEGSADGPCGRCGACQTRDKAMS